MQNLMMVFTFSVFDWKYLFWRNLVQKIKIFNLKNVFFTLEIITSAFFVITTLKYKDHPNFYQFFLLLLGDVILNLGPIQKSLGEN